MTTPLRTVRQHRRDDPMRASRDEPARHRPTTGAAPVKPAPHHHADDDPAAPPARTARCRRGATAAYGRPRHDAQERRAPTPAACSRAPHTPGTGRQHPAGAPRRSDAPAPDPRRRAARTPRPTIPAAASIQPPTPDNASQEPHPLPRTTAHHTRITPIPAGRVRLPRPTTSTAPPASLVRVAPRVHRRRHHTGGDRQQQRPGGHVHRSGHHERDHRRPRTRRHHRLRRAAAIEAAISARDAGVHTSPHPRSGDSGGGSDASDDQITSPSTTSGRTATSVTTPSASPHRPAAGTDGRCWSSARAARPTSWQPCWSCPSARDHRPCPASATPPAGGTGAPRRRSSRAAERSGTRRSAARSWCSEAPPYRPVGHHPRDPRFPGDSQPQHPDAAEVVQPVAWPPDRPPRTAASPPPTAPARSPTARPRSWSAPRAAPGSRAPRTRSAATADAADDDAEETSALPAPARADPTPTPRICSSRHLRGDSSDDGTEETGRPERLDEETEQQQRRNDLGLHRATRREGDRSGQQSPAALL
ncbi:hypothetical protein SAMN05443637_12822 [Pseudonocardia thermophila]|uniref:Uncharacterized protein n=1 Tax=Pseudonocardia thermophila TaxID=1848 RepID=A0A1M7AI54_PSETH|nr:hypothetical protein SAMN05443637_12822 [Pseudonocardia thermophila]